jgi:hypothetical protein
LIDYQKCNGNVEKLYDGKSAEEVIIKYLEDIKNKLEDVEKAKKKQPKKTSEMTEEERKKFLDDYFTKLSKPKDRFEKLKMLQELLKQFPKDRVIRRMIDAELVENPDAPSEFLKTPGT